MFQKINKFLAYPVIRFIRLYQMTLSPDKGLPSLRLKWRICMHTPHCSQYSIQVLRRYGFWPGIGYALDRVLHCTGGMKKIYDPDHYRVVFFSWAPIGVPFLHALAEDKKFEIVWVVTQWDKPVGRWMEMTENIIKQEAQKLLSSSSTSVSFWKGELQKLIHKVAREKHIYSEASIVQTIFARGMRKRPTKTEDILRNILRNRQFLDMKRRRQFPINKYVADFYCHEYKTIIEVDWNIHNTEAQERIDEERNKTLQNLGYTILRFKNEEISDNLEEVLTKIARITSPSLKERGPGGEDFPLSEGEGARGWGLIQTPARLHPSKSEEGLQFTERLKEKKPDFLVVIAYGKIIPQAILDIPKIAPINVHGSLLPKYRWASPIQSCLLNDDKETWITIMKMDATMDTGNMIDKLGFKIGFDRTSKNIIENIQHYWPKFLNNTLRKYGKWMLGEVKQNETEASYCAKIEKESWLIDPRKDSLHDIYCRYRAYYQWPKIYFILHDKRIIIENIKIYEGADTKKPLIYQNNTLNEAIEDIVLKPEGKKSMSRKECVNWWYLR